MDYQNIKNKLVAGRYIQYDILEEYLLNLPSQIKVKAEGESVSKRKIYSATIGHGDCKILMWSQMHGNESTTTKAILDFINYVLIDSKYAADFAGSCTLKLIPILNPDGAVAYTRQNANQVDLNRDAINKTQPESLLLQKIAKEFQPNFCFNMHDQRTIFGVSTTGKPATLSFLAPSYNTERDINPTRKIAMQIIAGINAKLQQEIPGQIARFDDGFNLNCVGDFFQAQQIPTMLFEAGHYPKDYPREITREYVFKALLEAFDCIQHKSWSAYKESSYFKIPENQKNFVDILIREADVEGKIQDIGIQYQEICQNKSIKFIPKLLKITKMEDYFGHIEINAKQKKTQLFLKPTQEIESVIEKIVINDKIIPITLTNN